MATKVYGISGFSTTVMRIPAGEGKAWIECEFTRGNPSRGAYYRPATYATADKTIQSIIEHSLYFNRLIKLVKVYDDEPEKVISNGVKTAKVIKTADAEAVVEAKEIGEISSYEDAISYLKSIGAKATQLRSVDAIKKFMSQKGVAFPNYNFE